MYLDTETYKLYSPPPRSTNANLNTRFTVTIQEKDERTLRHLLD